VNGRLRFGYPYMPLTLLMSLPGYLVAGDVRYSHLAAMVAAAALIAYARPSRLSFAAAALLLLQPRGLYILERSWCEPQVVLLLAATVFAAARGSRYVPLSLGLLIVSKQYMLATAALRRCLSRCGIAAGFSPSPVKRYWLRWSRTLPLAMLAPAGFWRSAVALQFASFTAGIRPLRRMARTFQKLAARCASRAVVAGVRTAGRHDRARPAAGCRAQRRVRVSCRGELLRLLRVREAGVCELLLSRDWRDVFAPLRRSVHPRPRRRKCISPPRPPRSAAGLLAERTGAWRCATCGITSATSASTWRRCAGCGLLVTQPMPADDVIEHYYSTKYRGDRHAFTDRMRVKLRARMLQRHFPPGFRGRLLDIAAATATSPCTCATRVADFRDGNQSGHDRAPSRDRHRSQDAR
jgi:hypothetical protein